MAKDPVCGMDVDEKKAAATSKCKGNPIIFVLRVTMWHLTRIQRNIQEKRKKWNTSADQELGFRKKVTTILDFSTGFTNTVIMKSKIISSSPDVMGGTPVFTGTRVPIQTLLDYLEGGESIDDFLEGFPTVTREQVIAFLQEAKEQIVASVK